MTLSLRLGFILSVIGLAAVAGLLAGPVANPGAGTRIAYAAEPVDIELHGGGGFEAISLDTACSTSLYPGLLCTDRIEVRNTGNLPFVYEIQAWSDADGFDDGLPGHADEVLATCVNVNVEPETADGFDTGDQSAWGPEPGLLLAGTVQAWGLEVSVDDDNACQGQHAFVFAYVIATEDEAGLPDEPPPVADGTGDPAGDGAGGADDGGGGGGGGGSAQPPGSPLDGPVVQFVPPATGGGGLIGARPVADDGRSALLSLLALAFSLAGLACAGGLRALERRQ